MTSIHVLLVCANPRGTDPLRLAEEERTLKEAIRLSQHRDRIKVTVLNAARIDDLRRALLRDKFDIVHFSGHGTRAGLIFEDENGRLMVPDPEALAELLGRRRITTTILNACYSLNTGVFGSVALDYTIAIDGPIADIAAIEFSRGFYDALGAGLDIPDAYAEGLSCCKLKHLSLTAVLLPKGTPSTSRALPDVTGPDRPDPRDTQTQECPDRRLLLGIAIDTSGSMASSIRNEQHGTLTRLTSVKHGLARLARGVRQELRAHTAAQRPLDTLRIFVYAFGLRHTNIADLLSVVRATDSVDIQAEIEGRKRRHEAAAQRRYSGLAGLGSLARGYGFGGIVDDLERSARASAERTIRFEITSEIADLLLQKTRAVGDTTFTPSELAELLERPGDKDILVEVEPLVYGDTPMLALATELRKRFARHPRHEQEDRILLVISDGEPTDGDPLPEFKLLKDSGVTIVACYVTDDDVSNPRLLLARTEDGWPSGARLMFDAASEIDENGSFAKHLLRKGWCIEKGARLFVQVNHSDVLEEFIQIAGSPLSQYETGATDGGAYPRRPL